MHLYVGVCAHVCVCVCGGGIAPCCMLCVGVPVRLPLLLFDLLEQRICSGSITHLCAPQATHVSLFFVRSTKRLHAPVLLR